MSDKTPVPTTTMELRMQQLATDLHALQAELERLLVEKRFQAKQTASLAGERNHLAQQHAAAISSNEQAMRIIDSLRARLEEASAERAILQSSYECSQGLEHERSVAENSALAAELNVTEANLNATEANLNATRRSLMSLRRITMPLRQSFYHWLPIIAGLRTSYRLSLPRVDGERCPFITASGKHYHVCDPGLSMTSA